jgi:tetratricopeptide (TPR) repeat protein
MVVLPKEKPVKKELIDHSSKYETLEIIWDTSLSSEKRDRVKELAFLDRFFAEHKNITYRVELKTMDISLHSQGSFRVANGEWKSLRKKLETLRYNGAKDFSKLKVDRKAHQIFLFSNGINTFSDSVSVKKGAPVVVISSAAGSNADTLRYIASLSGGKFLDLSQMEVDDAIKKLSKKDAFRIRKHSKSIDDTYVKSLGDSIVVLGRIRGSKGAFTYRVAGEDHQVTITDAVPSDLLSRVWAGSKIENLSMRSKKNKKKIIALSQKQKIVTRYTSMIVLDRVEDYVRYEIVPPRSLQKRYYTLLKEKKREMRSEKKWAIEESVELMKEQKKWYRTKFPIKQPKYKEEEELGMGGDIAPVEPVVEVSDAAAPSSSRQKKKKKHSQADQTMAINLKEWNSNASYIQALDGVPNNKLVDKYFALREKHKAEPSFYVDMADYFQKKELKKEALLILSNLLELDFDNSEFIRVFAFKLMEYHRYSQAIFFFQKVRELRPFELQSTRDLALAYERAGQYQTALNLHYSILTKIWDGRFTGAKIVTINELNHLISKHRLSTSRIDRRLIARMPVDMRIVINWSTDNTDMDLWVIDPKEEKTYYGNRTSRIGGKISNDMTQGYGPEEFMLKKALRGNYVIKVKYYGTSQQKLTGPTVIRAEVYTHYGKRNEKREEIVFRVEEEKEVIDLGEIVY